jgi:hypothetical protein
MAVKITYDKEINQLIEYLKSEESEDAKRPLIFPLFQKLFKDKFKSESSAYGADVYIEGKLLVECKTNYFSWLEGFFQAMHYHKKFGLVYSLIIVIAHKFVGMWRVNKLPEFAVKLSHLSDVNKAPNVIGKENAKNTSQSEKKIIQDSAIYWLEPKDLSGDYFKGEAKSILIEVHEIFNLIRNTDAERLQVNTRNFIENIESLKKFFDQPIDAVHCFYSIVAYWDITSTVSTNEYGNEIRVVGFKGQKYSEEVSINPSRFKEFKKFVEGRYVFTNEGSGLTVDYYFGRFDEVMAKIDPEYVKQHGIFFTDINLSKFALWFARGVLGNILNEQYIFFDPAGGSGNLISSWRGKLKHKIISELQPDLLRIIERRMRIDPWHIETGFTIIPKTSENKGLNFLDCSAANYLGELERELSTKNISINKPIAFLLNPPYKNIREKESNRTETDSEYLVDESILKVTGPDGSKERYLSFLAQILNISILLSKNSNTQRPIILIFTPTSWLIPRIAFKPFRKTFDKYFNFRDGFIITSNEFFKLEGTWPLAFSIWEYEFDENRTNEIIVNDFTHFTKESLLLNWNSDERFIYEFFKPVLSSSNRINLSVKQTCIRETLPDLQTDDGDYQKAGMQNFYRSRNKDEIGVRIISGFALKDDRHIRVKAPHGYVDGTYVGFMDDLSPVRIKPKSDIRYTNKTAKDTVWFRIDTAVKDVNKSKCFNGPTDNRSYCAYDLQSAKIVFSWFSITKAINGKYPIWANQIDIWPPKIKSKYEAYYYAHCLAFVLAENRCVVTKFEENNPVQGASEIFVDNPLCPSNPESFWSQVLDKQVLKEHKLAFQLVEKIKDIYRKWNLDYCKGQYLYQVGLQAEPYFKYFDYAPFLTPYSGLIQIRKYAELNTFEDLLILFTEISDLTKKVKEEIYRLLVEEFKYFE